MMNRFMHRHILLPAFESLFKRRKTLRYWSELERTQWLSSGEVEAIQFNALVKLFTHAYAHSPFYRDDWDRRGLHPRQLRSVADLARWPVIDRDTIRRERSNLRATRPAMKLISKSTGGSTGVPLHFDLDLESHERRTAAAHRGYAWAAAAPGTKQLYLWGSALGERSRRARLKDAIYHRLQRRRVVSCFDTGGDLASRFAAELERYRPDAIVAYTNPIYEVARELEAKAALPRHRPAAIVVGAEKLHPFQREVIERVFRARVFETYGSREFMLIGSECEQHNGLHITAEQLVVEVLDDDGTPTPHGLEGNVVITDIYNYGMPFIRYANGDRAVAGLGTCGCGRGLPLLKKVVGRRLDVLQASGGRLVPGEFFPHLVKDFPAVRRFQVVQESAEHCRFSLAADGLADADRIELERRVRHAMGPDVRVDFETVPQIALTSAGKLHVVVNRMPERKAG